MSANHMTVGKLISHLLKFDLSQRVVVNSTRYRDRTECDVDGPYPPYEVTGHEIRSGWMVADTERGRCYGNCDGSDPDLHERLVVLSDINYTPEMLVKEMWKDG